MQVYMFRDPIDFRYAIAGTRGTWVYEQGQELCVECGAAPKPVSPLIIEWEPGSEEIGDFIWPGYVIVVTQRVRDALLQEQFKGVEFGPIKMQQDPKIKRPQRITKRTKPRVWLPYEGPPLYNLRATTWLAADLQRSSIRVASQCSVCGHKTYEVKGVEIYEHRWDQSKKDLVEVYVPRLENQGILIPQSELQEASIFSIKELPLWILCTEPVKNVIEAYGFTNVGFLEVGEDF